MASFADVDGVSWQRTLTRESLHGHWMKFQKMGRLDSRHESLENIATSRISRQVFIQIWEMSHRTLISKPVIVPVWRLGVPRVAILGKFFQIPENHSTLSFREEIYKAFHSHITALASNDALDDGQKLGNNRETAWGD